MSVDCPVSPPSDNQPHRSFAHTAIVAGHVLDTFLGRSPVPTGLGGPGNGRAALSDATADAVVLFVLLSLTLGYAKTSDEFTMQTLVDLTGMSRRRLGRTLARLAASGLVEYTPASTPPKAAPANRRPLCRVVLRVPRRDSRTQSVDVTVHDYRDLTGALRSFLPVVCAASGPSVPLVALALVRMTVCRGRLDVELSTRSLAAVTGLDARQVGRCLKALDGSGAITYRAGCGRGVLGSVTVLGAAGAIPPRRARALQPQQKATLSLEDADRLNDFAGMVAHRLDSQLLDQGAAFLDAVRAMDQQRKFAQRTLALLDAGLANTLGDALTRRGIYDGPALAGAEDPRKVIMARLNACYDQHADMVAPAARVAGLTERWSTDRR